MMGFGLTGKLIAAGVAVVLLTGAGWFVVRKIEEPWRLKLEAEQTARAQERAATAAAHDAQARLIRETEKINADLRQGYVAVEKAHAACDSPAGRAALDRVRDILSHSEQGSDPAHPRQ